MLGYVPKEMSKEVNQLIAEHEDEGNCAMTSGLILCIITEVNSEAVPWNRVKVVVSEEEK